MTIGNGQNRTGGTPATLYIGSSRGEPAMTSPTTIRTACPRDCYDACGVLVKTSADGTINVVGDPDHDVSRGALCGKCSIGYNGIWRDPNVRLMSPLKRVGAKGSGSFQPVGWNEALG